MFSGRFSTKPSTSDGRYFVDRDGTHFGYVLNWLRDGSCYLPHEDERVLSQLLAKANFYQITDLRDRVQQLLDALLDPDDQVDDACLASTSPRVGPKKG